MADKIMRMEQPGVQLKSLPVTSLQRKCAHCEEEEKKMQLKEINSTKASADSNLESYVGGLNSSGQFLPKDVRSFYEPRFGYDFSQVKVHTDSVAAKSAQSINALAFTSGSNIVFNSGQYSPGSESGKRLLGHELTHVVQQGDGITPKIQRQQVTTPTSCPGSVVGAVYSRGNDDWAECDYETARISVNLILDPCTCSSSGTTMPLSVNYSAILEGKSFTGRTIPNPSGTGTIREQEGQASHIATGVVTPGRSRTPGTQPGMRLSEDNLPAGTPANVSGPLVLAVDDRNRGGRPGDPGDTVSQRLSLGSLPCIGGSTSGQVSLGGGFQVINYSISASSTSVQQASITLTESGRMAGRIPTPLIDITSGANPYPRFPGNQRPGGTGCTCDPVTGRQNGTGCSRGPGGAGFGRP